MDNRTKNGGVTLKAKILFVYPFPGDTFGEIVDLGESIGGLSLETHGLPCHVAIYSCGQILEAVVPMVKFSPLDQYDDYRTDPIEVEVPCLAAAEAWAPAQIGRMYSFLSDAEAEYYALTGKLLNYQDGGVMCSQLAMEWLRVAGLPVFGAKPAWVIRPADLRNELLKCNG